MPTVTVGGSVTLQEAAEALHGKLGDRYEIGIAKKVAMAITEAFAARPGS